MTDPDHSLPIWTIYFGGRDMPPGIYRVRRCVTSAAGVAHDAECTDHQTLAAARHALIERGLARIDRHPSDEPQIVECWL